jgi:putative peptidoglycan lipid II flippase
MDSQIQSEKKQILKSAGVTGFWTAFSRVAGLIRDQVQAYFMGTSHSADAFRVAFQLPNLFRRLVAEGAMTASFVPVFTDFLKKKDSKETWKFANNCLYSLGLLLILLTILGIIFSGPLVQLLAEGFEGQSGKIELATDLSRVMFVYLFFIGISALFGAILNSIGVFGAPSFTPVLLNISIIAAAAFFSKSCSDPAFAFALGVIIGGFLQMAFLIPFIIKKGMNFHAVLDLKQKELLMVAKRMLPGILAVGVQQINVLVSTRIASNQEGWIASLYHANRLEEFTLGIFVVSISTVMLPLLSRHASENRLDALKESLTFSLRITLLITIPATVGLILFREPIIRVLFMHGKFDQRSLDLTSTALLFYVLGLAAFSWTKIIAPAFFSLKDVKTPVYISCVTVGVNLLGCLLLKDPLKNGGLALAATISAIVNVAILLYIFQKRWGVLNNKLISLSFIRTIAASAVMGIPLFFLNDRLDGFAHLRLLPQICLLAVIIIFSAGIYLAVLKLMKSHEVDELFAIIRNRARKSSDGIQNTTHRGQNQ